MFAFGCGESRKVEGFFVSAEFDRNECLYYVKLEDWIKYMDIVGHDDIVEMNLHFNKKKNDYVATSKKDSRASKK